MKWSHCRRGRNVEDFMKFICKIKALNNEVALKLYLGEVLLELPNSKIVNTDELIGSLFGFLTSVITS